MKITLLDNPEEIRRRFVGRFVEAKERSRPYLWEMLPADFEDVSFREALALLKGIDGDVVFISEEGSHCSCELNLDGQKLKGFAAMADAGELAELIEEEWFGAVRLLEQGMYAPNPILPDDLYVFDVSMSRLVVFTHETTDWESEIDEPMKAAESRYCIAHLQ